MKNKIFQTVFVFVLLIGVFFIVKGLLYSEEERILRVLEKGRKALEEERVEEVMECVSSEFEAGKGINYFTLPRLLRGFFQEWERINIKKKVEKVKVKDRMGEVELTVNATARRKNGEEKRIYQERVRITLHKKGGRWKILGVKLLEEEI